MPEVGMQELRLCEVSHVLHLDADIHNRSAAATSAGGGNWAAIPADVGLDRETGAVTLP